MRGIYISIRIPESGLERENLLNPLPNDNFLTKLKAFADDKINAGKLKISVFERVENIVGKGKNAGYQHFLPLPQCFVKPSL